MSIPASGLPGGPTGPTGSPAGPLDRKLCQVGGVNQNYTSAAGTLYHIQIEDRGPVMDRASARELRRVNVIVYANYGEQNAQIVHGRDHDYPDIRSHAHNTFIKSRIADLAAEARRVIEEAEQKQVMRIKCLIREYYLTKSEAVKKQFEEARSAADIVKELAAQIQQIMGDIDDGLQRLKAAGKSDDILVQTCRKLITRAQETLADPEASGFTVRRLEMTRNSLSTTLRRVASRLKANV